MRPSFNLEAAIASWRRSLEHRNVILPEDLDELEQHVRDQFTILTQEGVPAQEAYRKIVAAMGDQSEIEAAFRRVYWPKLRRKGMIRRHVGFRLGMVRSYLRVSFRSLMKRKAYTAINVVGLAVGLASGLLIMHYVATELSFDEFHEDKDRIYRVRHDLFRGEERLFKVATTYPAVGPTAESTFPEIESVSRLFLWYNGGVVRIADRSFREERVFSADSNFFSFFSFPLIIGDRSTALSRPFTAVLSSETAEKYFGDENPIGRMMTFSNGHEYEITGVATSPERSHLKFKVLLSLDESALGSGFTQQAWNWYDFYTYLKLKRGAEPRTVERGFPDMIARHKGPAAAAREVLTLQPLTDIHLHSDLLQEAGVNGSASSVSYLAVIGIIILIIAWLNYVNLSTARAMERAREVSVRKTVGARRSDLVGQFVLESVIVNALAGILALILAWIALPAFHSILGRDVLPELDIGRPWVTITVVFLVGALLSGFYPALVLSSYRPSAVLRGASSSGREGLRLRRGLVLIQFAASVALIAGTIIIYQQIDYMRGRDLGIDIDRSLVLDSPDIVADDTLRTLRAAAFKEELLRNPHIQSVAATSEIPGNLIYWTSGARKLRDDPEVSISLYRIGVDDQYFETLDHRLLAGRSFEEDRDRESNRIVVNEAAFSALGLANASDALGERLQVGGDTLEVIGVVENYHQEGLDRAYYPIAFQHQTAEHAYFVLRAAPAQTVSVIQTARRAFESSFPDNPFTYFFLDRHFDRQYRSYRQFGTVFGFFSALALFVACLGLSGLASFAAARRTKEIGIRKVLGSDVVSILLLLSKDFLVLVAAAAAIAVPLIWFLMREWLQGFAFRLDLTPWPFVIAFIAVLVITLLTVSAQSLRAAVSNPVDTLRYE